jgi:branched-chain amino acid transport system permease protein
MVAATQAGAPAKPVGAWSEPLAFAAMVLLLVVLPAFVYPVFLMKALCFALFACAFNLLIGYVGLLSFGHALFFGWAGYLSAHLAKVGQLSFPFWAGGWQWIVIPLPPLPPELAILGGTATAALLGLIVGSIAIRRQGIYFAMITLALAQMMFFFAVQAPFTHGEDGIQAVPRGRLFGLVDLSNQTNMYITVAVIFLASFLMIYRIINSPFGEVLKAIRENEPRAISLGYRTERYKLMAFVLSATFAGVAGATKSIVFQLASLTDVDWPTSGEVILMTLVGGLGTVFGPVIGALTVVAMENYLTTTIGQWVSVVQGSIFVFCVLLFRRGIVGELAHWLRVRL